MNIIFNNFIISSGKLELKRKLSRTSRVKPSIAAYSEKNKFMQYVESKLELDAMMRLEFDTSVKSYLTQPCSVYLEIDGKRRRYTPDTLVETIDGDYYFVEVKPKNKADKPEFIHKFEQITDYFKNEVGIEIKLLTDDVIHCNKLISNLEQLYPYISMPMKPRINDRILNMINEPMAIKDIEIICRKFAKTSNYVWGLIANGFFNFNNSTVLKRTDIITVNPAKLGA
jgi:hypothetical protein